MQEKIIEGVKRGTKRMTMMSGIRLSDIVCNKVTGNYGEAFVIWNRMEKREWKRCQIYFWRFNDIVLKVYS